VYKKVVGTNKIKIGKLKSRLMGSWHMGYNKTWYNSGQKFQLNTCSKHIEVWCKRWGPINMDGKHRVFVNSIVATG